MMGTKELAEFLEEANRHTYAAGAQHTTSTRLGSNNFEYKRGELLYHDTYFGPRDFLGNEIVYKNEKPVWGLNYHGFILDDSYTNDEVYTFLKKALMQKPDDTLPVRGPLEYADGVWTYGNKVEGELGRLQGEETIAHKGKIVYRCLYHGGWIH